MKKRIIVFEVFTPLTQHRLKLWESVKEDFPSFEFFFNHLNSKQILLELNDYIFNKDSKWSYDIAFFHDSDLSIVKSDVFKKLEKQNNFFIHYSGVYTGYLIASNQITEMNISYLSKNLSSFLNEAFLNNEFNLNTLIGFDKLLEDLLLLFQNITPFGTLSPELIEAKKKLVSHIK